VVHFACRPCENGGGLKIASGMAVGMTGIRHFPPKIRSRPRLSFLERPEAALAAQSGAI